MLAGSADAFSSAQQGTSTGVQMKWGGAKVNLTQIACRGEGGVASRGSALFYLYRQY